MSSLTRAYTRQAHIPQLTSLTVKHLCRSILLTFLHKCLLTNQTDRRLLWNASTKTLLNNNRHYTYLYTGINVCVVAVINLGCYKTRQLPSPSAYTEISGKVSIPYSKYPRLYLYLYSCICYAGKQKREALQQTPPLFLQHPRPSLRRGTLVWGYRNSSCICKVCAKDVTHLPYAVVIRSSHTQ